MPKSLLIICGCAALMVFGSCGRTGGLSAQQCNEKGQALLREGKKKEAYEFLSAAVKKDNTNPEYEWAAAQAAPDRDKAFMHATAAWKGGAKSYAVLNTLSILSLQADAQQRLNYTLQLYGELPDSLKTTLYLADILHQFGKFDSALTLWHASFDSVASPQIANRIATVYGQTNRPLKSIEFLEACRARDLLDATGYIILATSYAVTDSITTAERILTEARSKGRSDITTAINEAMVALASGSDDRAQTLLLSALENPENAPAQALRDIRGLLLLIYASRRDTARIAELSTKITGDETAGKAEKTLFEGVLQIVKGDSTGRDKIKVAEQVLTGSAVVRLMMARESLSQKKFEDALKMYRSLPVLLTRAPQVALEIARAQAGAGNDDAALMVVSSLHKRKFINRETLSLFRDLALKKQMVEKATAAQALLEKQYGADAQVKWAGAMLASRMGKTDSALALLESLSQQYPQEERFARARVTMLLLTKEYAKVIDESEKSTHASALAPLKARALYELGKADQAVQTFEQALTANRSRAGLLEYANFLTSIGENKKAAVALKEIVDSIKTGKGAKPDFEMAAVLNNFAWTGLQSGLYDPRDMLKAAQKAHEIAPDNINIMDTYALALLKNGREKEVAALLDSVALAAKKASLAVYLGQANEKLKDNFKAIRAYRHALSVWDSTGGDESGMLTKEQVSAAIARMSDGK